MATTFKSLLIPAFIFLCIFAVISNISIDSMNSPNMPSETKITILEMTGNYNENLNISKFETDPSTQANGSNEGQGDFVKEYYDSSSKVESVLGMFDQVTNIPNFIVAGLGFDLVEFNPYILIATTIIAILVLIATYVFFFQKKPE